MSTDRTEAARPGPVDGTHPVLLAEQTEQRLFPAPHRGLLVAALLVVLACGVLVTVFAAGWVPHSHTATAASPVAPSVVGLLGRIVLAVGLIACLATLGGTLVRRIGQPAVVGEILVGLAIGPSVLGAVAPAASSAVFGPQVLPYVNLAAQAGLAIFMFGVGTEFDLGMFGRNRTAVGAAGLAIMVVPFVLGLVAALPLFSSLAGPAADPLSFVLFVGTALSVTAFPVLARIVQDAGLRGTRLGVLAMSCAAIVDVLAWCALAFVLAMVRTQDFLGVVRALGLAVLLAVACLAGVRPLLRGLATRYAHRLPTPLQPLLVLFLVIGLAVATDRIGVHAILGGFLAGLVLPTDTPVLGAAAEGVCRVNRWVLVPVFFASIGMQANMELALARPEVLAGGALLFAVAMIGKLCSAVPVALAGALPARPAIGLGVLVNARGITEIVVLGTGLAVGVINAAACTVLVVVALLTTMMVTPLLKLLGLSRPARPRRIEATRELPTP